MRKNLDIKGLLRSGLFCCVPIILLSAPLVKAETAPALSNRTYAAVVQNINGMTNTAISLANDGQCSSAASMVSRVKARIERYDIQDQGLLNLVAQAEGLLSSCAEQGASNTKASTDAGNLLKSAIAAVQAGNCEQAESLVSQAGALAAQNNVNVSEIGSLLADVRKMGSSCRNQAREISTNRIPSASTSTDENQTSTTSDNNTYHNICGNAKYVKTASPNILYVVESITGNIPSCTYSQPPVCKNSNGAAIINLRLHKPGSMIPGNKPAPESGTMTCRLGTSPTLTLSDGSSFRASSETQDMYIFVPSWMNTYFNPTTKDAMFFF